MRHAARFGGATALFGSTTSALSLLLAPLAVGVALLLTTHIPVGDADTGRPVGNSV